MTLYWLRNCKVMDNLVGLLLVFPPAVGGNSSLRSELWALNYFKGGCRKNLQPPFVSLLQAFNSLNETVSSAFAFVYD